MTASLSDHHSVEKIAERLNLPRQTVGAVLAFLVETQLLKQDGRGFSLGPQRTHIEADSPWAKTHHRNWRLKCLQHHDRLGKDELAFTAPMTIARHDVAKVRAELVSAIERASKIVDKTEPDTMACLGIDWVVV